MLNQGNTLFQTQAAETASADPQARFGVIQNALRRDVGETAFRSWIAPIAVVGFHNSVLELSVPTRFVRDWVRSHYADKIKALWAQQFGAINRVEILISARQAQQATAQQDGDNTVVAFVKPEDNGVEEGIDPTGLSSPLDPRYTFDTFVTGTPNDFAAAAARKVATSGDVSFNPLIIHGAVGLGKTHLLQAIAHEARQTRKGARVVYMSAEKFMYQFVRALRFKDTMSFKEHLRSIDVLMIDDIQFICGKESTQEEFFHTFNALIDQGKQVVITADRSPAEMDGLGERLRSRLSGGLVAAVNPLTPELRLQVLQSKCAQMKRDIPAGVLSFLAQRITASTRELEGALSRLIAHAELTGRAVTEESAQELLESDNLLQDDITALKRNLGV